jgi:hypothetical protein
MRRSALIALAVLAVSMSGCRSPQADEISTVARSWFQHVQEHDGAALCRLLAGNAAEALQSSSGEPCQQSVLGLDLPTATVRSVEVWGERAEVRASRDTLFLTRLASGWKVSAAGCTPRADRPYDCTIEG